MSTIDLARGTAGDRLRGIQDRNGDAFAPTTNPSPFLSSDLIAATVWTGDDAAPLLTPTVAWVDATGVASYQLSFHSADTAAWPLATYRGQTTVTRANRTGVVDNWLLRLTASPGTTVAPLTFTTTDHLRQYAPWIENLQSEYSSAGFADEQLRATNWLIDVLCNLWRMPNMAPTAGQPGFAASASMGGGEFNSSNWLRSQLIPQVATGNLNPQSAVPPTGSCVGNQAIYTALLLRSWVVEACAKMAISYICAAQLGRGEKGETYWGLASKFQRDAENIAKCNRAEFDFSTPQTGYGQSINLGATSVR